MSSPFTAHKSGFVAKQKWVCVFTHMYESPSGNVWLLCFDIIRGSGIELEKYREKFIFFYFLLVFTYIRGS